MARFIIHKTKHEAAKEASNYIFDKLNELYPGKARRHYNDSVISLGNGITIDFRCGTECDKLAGVWPNYYYTDSSEGYIAEMLEQGACKVNGMRLDSVDDMIEIIRFYMSMFSEIDEWLTANKMRSSE